MKKIISKGLLTVIFAMVISLAVAAESNAASVNVAFDAGTTQETTALTGFGTTGDLMAGMSLTAYFSNNTSETVTWLDLGGLSGGATGTGWSLFETGDTWDQNWTLTSTGAQIDRLFIDGGVGDTVFDTYFGGVTGTTGSALGKNFSVTGGLGAYDITATYRDAVALTGNAAVGDLFRYLDIDFTTSAFGSGTTTLTFITDTDNLKFGGDIAAVPEPSTYILLGSGLMGLAWVRRRFKK